MGKGTSPLTERCELLFLTSRKLDFNTSWIIHDWASFDHVAFSNFLAITFIIVFPICLAPKYYLLQLRQFDCHVKSVHASLRFWCGNADSSRTTISKNMRNKKL